MSDLPRRRRRFHGGRSSVGWTGTGRRCFPIRMEGRGGGPSTGKDCRKEDDAEFTRRYGEVGPGPRIGPGFFLVSARNKICYAHVMLWISLLCGADENL